MYLAHFIIVVHTELHIGGGMMRKEQHVMSIKFLPVDYKVGIADPQHCHIDY
jgi:hypothetical protein